MKKIKSPIEGVFLLEPLPSKDTRGTFTRIWDKKVFNKSGIGWDIVNINISTSYKKGTLRGMHIQKSPHGEDKLITVVKGKIFDVVIDLRINSKTYMKWQSFVLDEDDFKTINVPKGCAHGFLTLKDNTSLVYAISQYYYPLSEAGINYADPQFSIKWPGQIKVISMNDKKLPNYKKGLKK